VAGLLSATVSALLLVTRRAGLKTYIPFGPFLVAGMVVTLLRDPALLGEAVAIVVERLPLT
jgi:prepilin signal peptidase PulO-like enzyme (type II secretory pathway)